MSVSSSAGWQLLSQASRFVRPKFSCSVLVTGPWRRKWCACIGSLNDLHFLCWILGVSYSDGLYKQLVIHTTCVHLSCFPPFRESFFLIAWYLISQDDQQDSFLRTCCLPPQFNDLSIRICGRTGPSQKLSQQWNRRWAKCKFAARRQLPDLGCEDEGGRTPD